MAREPEELVEMRRALGAQLTAYREAAQLSQGQLAIPAGVDRTTVNHIEKARSRADERFWKIVDDKCHADGMLLAGFHAWQAAKQDHDVRTQQAQLTEARAKAEALRATAVTELLRQTNRPIAPDGEPPAADHSATPDGTEPTEDVAGSLESLELVGSLAGDMPAAVPDEVIGQLARLLCEWIGAMNRRELFELLKWAAGAAATSSAVTGLNTDELERLTRAIISPNRVDEKVIKNIEAMLRYCKRQQKALGARAVLNTMIAQQNLVNDLLGECPTDLRPRLLSVYSNMSTSIGYDFFDKLNDPASAERYWDQARAAAREADNAELGIYALCEMSHAACWQGKAHTAIDTAAAARSLISKTDDPFMQVYVADRAAQAYAIGGQHKECMAECEKAHDSLASAGHVPVESPANWYHEGLLASEESGCLLRLRKPHEAIVSANNGLALFGNSFMNNRAFCTLFLGNAYLQCDEIEEAARVIGDAAGLAAQTRSTRLMKELRTTRTQMQPWRDNPAVKTLDDQLVTYGLAPSSAM